MTYVHCEKCDKYYDAEELVYVRPDVGAFCPDCHSDYLDFMSEEEVLEALNESR